MTVDQNIKPPLLSKRLLKALSLEERATIILKNEDIGLTDEEIKHLTDDWKDKALLKDYALDAKLREVNLDRKSFAKILHISADPNWTKQFEVIEQQQPYWMKLIDEAFTLNRDHLVKDSEDLNLSFAYRPFLLWARFKLEQYYQDHPILEELVNWDKLLPSLMYNLASGLTQVGARTFVLEMHVCKKMNELQGDTPEDRLQFYIREKLLNPDYLEFIYGEYPVLAKVVMTKTDYFITNTIEALDRFLSDWSLLGEKLHIKEHVLEKITAELGDSHQKGKSVMKFKFTNDLEILYKPKSLSLSHDFGKLLDWFNEKGFEPKLQSYSIISREEYAWEEKIEYVGCETEKEIENYYYRLGGLLAVLYLVRGTDFHSENLIAKGEYPILIDLETLFHPISKMNFEPSADLAAKEKIHNSVLGTALLPHLSFRRGDGKGIDLSGVSSTDKEMPIPILQVEDYGTDNMRFVRKPITSKESDQNVPKLNNKVVEASDYTEQIVAGFEAICDIVMNNKAELIKEEGVLSAFKEDTVRVIIRPTQFYGDFISESSHPDYLTDWLDREKLLDRLWFTNLDQRTIPLEIKDIMHNDIPVFFTTTDSVDLVSSTGERVPNFYEQSSYRNVIGRVEDLSLFTIEEQIGWIKASLLSNKKEDKYQIKTKEEILSEQSFDRELFIQEAEKIGDLLLEQAIYGEKNDATWISLETNYYGQWHVSPLDTSLYNGIGGITLFLSYLSNITQKEAYKDLADKSLESILYTPAYSSDFFSAYFGKAADIHVLSHYLSLFGKNNRVENVVNNRIDLLSDHIKNNSHFDLLGGSAGIIQVLLNAHEQFGSTKALQAAQKYGQHLLEHKVQMNNGYGWPDTNSNTCLGGLSHGTSGIAWSLLRLYEATKQEEFLEAALQAIAYDRSLYNHNHKNWEDLREGDMKVQEHSAAWCHGATGIGLSRLQYMNSIHDPMIKEEVGRAITAVEEVGMGRSHCLCHGDLGNSELFLSAGLKFKDQKLINFAHSIGSNVIKEKNENGKYSTGVSNKIELPGMFLGLSGIGYQLLRLVDPVSIPSILTLEPKK